jgi:UDP-galactopyranose mutase
MRPDIVIVGCGFFGATVAERAARDLGLRVLILDRRSHIGGNAYSEADPDTGIEVHRYGPHLFHTSNELVWNYLNRFTGFNDYRHSVFTTHRGRVFPMPVNLDTMCRFFGRQLSPDAARALVAAQAAELGDRPPANLEEKAISMIGRPLYEAFVRGYTQKQWQTDPRLLPAFVIARLPLRFTMENRYFADRYEGLPLDGYTAVFKRMLDDPRIEIRLDTDFFQCRDTLPTGVPVIYTGPVDRYFSNSEGSLRWRTVDFEREHFPTTDYQGCAVMNFADEDVPSTRSVEYRHLHPERRYGEGRTVVVRERAREALSGDEPYYPVGMPEDRAIYLRYSRRAAVEPGVIFGGRLGTYRYIDMHQAIAGALKLHERRIAPHFRDGARLKPPDGEAEGEE